ncbi:Amidophosphoribosyltransferase, partial [Haemophilus influenzae]
GRKF